VFSSRREHTVWLIRSLGDQIVYQDSNVGFVTIQDNGREAKNFPGCINTRHEPLGGCLLISCRSIDLSGEIEVLDEF